MKENIFHKADPNSPMYSSRDWKKIMLWISNFYKMLIAILPYLCEVNIKSKSKLYIQPYNTYRYLFKNTRKMS